MKVVITRGMVIALLALCAQASWAQVPGAPVPSELEETLRTRDTAVVNADAETWGRLTAADFTVVNQYGVMLNKAQKLAEIQKQRKKLPQPTRTDIKITMFGTSAVRRMKVNDDWVMELWVKDGQGWKAAAVQFTPAE